SLSTLFEIFGFLSVVLRGLDFVAQSVLLGSVTFAAFVATPLAGDVEERGLRRVFAGCRRVIRAAALATIVAVITAPVLTDAGRARAWRRTLAGRAAMLLAGAAARRHARACDPNRQAFLGARDHGSRPDPRRRRGIRGNVHRLDRRRVRHGLRRDGVGQKRP